MLWNMMNIDKDIVRVKNAQLVIIPIISITSLLQPKLLWQVFRPRLWLMRIPLTLSSKIALDILVTVIYVSLDVPIVLMDGLLVIKLVFVVKLVI
jgi:hypothetical protein